jgi:hypothetical protein
MPSPKLHKEQTCKQTQILGSSKGRVSDSLPDGKTTTSLPVLHPFIPSCQQASGIFFYKHEEHL